VGKLLPTPYPGQSMDEYREQLVNFQKNYWSFLKPSKGGIKFIPYPPLKLINQTKEMSTKKLSEHVEEELFNKDKRVKVPKPPKPLEPKVIKETEQPTPSVKKKKPYYRKKYTKSKPIDVVTPETVKTKNYFIHGLIIGVVLTTIIAGILWVYN
jgi:hypothetical protein